MIQRRAAPRSAVRRRAAPCSADGAQTVAALLRRTARSVNALLVAAWVACFNVACLRTDSIGRGFESLLELTFFNIFSKFDTK